MAAGSTTVEHAEPLLPALTTTTMPAARVFSTMVCKTVTFVQPSSGGQPQELLMTSGASSGFGFSLLRSVGAMNHWKHSAYVDGVPQPRSIFRQPIQRAPGATPIWLL